MQAIANLEQKQKDHHEKCVKQQQAYGDQLKPLRIAEIKELFAKGECSKLDGPALIEKHKLGLDRLLAQLRKKCAAAGQRREGDASKAVAETSSDTVLRHRARRRGAVRDESGLAVFQEGPIGMELNVDGTRGFVYVLNIFEGGQAETATPASTEGPALALQPGVVITHIGGEEIPPLPCKVADCGDVVDDAVTMITSAPRPLEIGFRLRTSEETTDLDEHIERNRKAWSSRRGAGRGGGTRKKQKYKKKKSRKRSKKKRSKKKRSNKKRSKKRTRRR